MGSKTRARELMQAAGVPIVPGTTAPVETLDDAARRGRGDRLPGRRQGGGRRRRQGLPRRADADRAGGRVRGRRARGREVLLRSHRVPRALPARTRATSRCRCWPTRTARVIHLGERDCSIQRRHQKLIEESPAPARRRRPARADRPHRDRRRARRRLPRARARSRACSPSGEYFFLEMNTRVQVEHCVTEATTGIDIVREQIRIAAGEPLSVAQADVALRGHAIECRINAEDAARNFAPAPGTITRYREPAGPGVRVDSGVRGRLGDPAAVRPDGGQADRLGRRPRVRHAADGPRAGRVRDRGRAHAPPLPPGDHGLGAVGARRDLPRPDRGPRLARAPGLPGAPRASPPRSAPSPLERTYTVEVSGKRFDVRVVGEAPAPTPTAPGRGRPRPAPRRERRGGPTAGGGDTLASPLQGNVFKVLVEQGATVEEGDADLHRRGDEDGERDHRPQGGRDRRAADQRGRRGVGRRHPRGHHTTD